MKQEEADAEESAEDPNALQIKQAFSLSPHQMTLKQRRQQMRIQALLKRGKDVDQSQYKTQAATMVFKFVYQNGQPIQVFVLGTLPSKQQLLAKVFEGTQAHVKFLLWCFQNVIAYGKDNRQDSSFLNIFSVGGSQNGDFYWVLKALVHLCGRDTHFYGDLYRIRCIWHENIKFYDLLSFFEDMNLEALCKRWLSCQRRELLEQTEPQELRECYLMYEVVQKFLHKF